MSEPTGKRCTRCAKIKPLEGFGRHRGMPDGLNSLCRDCCRDRNRHAARRRRAASPEARRANREGARRQHATNREAVFDHYGRSCACCGDIERLNIDHVNGDGREHRAQIGMGSSHLYRWLIANGFPAGFQVLCKTCNESKADGDGCRIDHLAA